MARSDELDSEAVHVLEAESPRRAKGPLVAGLLALVGLAGAGVWILLTDPFASRATPAAPPAAADNLLGEAWSFETTETSSPSSAWLVPDGAPAGFRFTAEAAVRGQTGAQAAPGPDGWARILSVSRWRLDGRVALVELSATSRSANVQLLVRHESEGRPPLDLVVASGSGELVGHARRLPGYDHVRVGIGCVGEGALDDVVLRLLAPDGTPRARTHGEGAEEPPAPRMQGVFQVWLADPPGLTVFRGDELVLRVESAALRDAEGRSLPSSAASLPGEGALALPDGRRVRVQPELAEEGRRLVLRSRLSDVPPGTVVVHHGLLAGSLAEAPVGIRSGRGFEQFTDDFRVEGVDALVLGRTQDRLFLEAGEPFTLSATRRADDLVALQLELPAAGDSLRQLLLQAEFKEERVRAAQLRDTARTHEAAGRLGAALAALEAITTDTPYDEEVLAEALESRARLQGVMQERLQRLDADLDDALFMGSAQRCREVRQAALAEAERFGGSQAEALFRQRAAAVEERAARLLAEDQQRRRRRVEALAESFAEHGGYPSTAAELQEYLARHLPAPATGGEP